MELPELLQQWSRKPPGIAAGYVMLGLVEPVVVALVPIPIARGEPGWEASEAKKEASGYLSKLEVPVGAEAARAGSG